MKLKELFPSAENRSSSSYKKTLVNYIAGKLWIVFRAALLIALCYILIYPLIYMFSMAFRGLVDMYDESVRWVPKTYTLDNVKRVWQAMNYPVAFRNTAFLSVTGACLSVVSCSLAGYGLARFRFRYQNILVGLAFIMIIVPPQFFSLSSYLNFKYADFFFLIKMLNLIPGVDIAHPSLLGSNLTLLLPSMFGAGVRSGLYIYIFRQFFKGMPKELEEAAYIDGCGYLKTFRKIMVPSAVPAITTCFLFSLVWNWNEYQLTGLFLEGKATLSASLVMLKDVIYKMEVLGGNTAIDLNRLVLDMQAGALLVVTPVLIIYLVFQRFFVEGIERTGIVE
ncbi:MAG: carbohydrate ABC transporter permease [Saccharofermentanales bacterium]